MFTQKDVDELNDDGTNKDLPDGGVDFGVYHIAKICHSVNRAYCIATGDDTQPSWEDAPGWQKDSACRGVVFHLRNPEATPASSHESWLAVKVAEGWVYGEKKDPENKIHPCMRPYDELPESQRVKDFLFKSIVDVMR